jgi:hypothetical protein
MSRDEIRKGIVILLLLLAGSISFAQNEVLYMWSGAVTSSSVKVNVKLADTSSSVRLVVSEDPSFTEPVYSGYASANSGNHRMVSLSIHGLFPSTKYYYAVESNGIMDKSPDDIGSFRTFAIGSFSYSFVVSSCAKESDHPVYEAMRKLEPLFYINMGDLHYNDVNSTNIYAYRNTYEDKVLSKPAAAKFFREVPIVYMWDDHDFTGNDSNGESIGREAARLAYQEYVPHYPLPAGTGDVPVYQSFTVGRVRFIITDLRSGRSAHAMMSKEQKQWLFNEMTDAQNNNQLIAWVSTVPFIGSDNDTWGGYGHDRKELGNFFRSNIINMFILGGDAHMLAIDNGDNSDFSSGFKRNPSRYPVFQASALNQEGSSKGGSYSHGAFPNPSAADGQFGLVTVTDNGDDDICVEFKGYRVSPPGYELQELLSYSFCRNIGSDLKYKVYPNPAQDAITLMIYNSRVEEPSVISVTDLSGRLMKLYPVEVAVGENMFDVDLGYDLPPGIYIVQFMLGNKMYSSKLVIAK